MDNETERLSKVVNSSGFPFQIGIEHKIKDTMANHDWRIVSHEYPWKNPETNNEGFIDLIISKYNGTQKMVIECKKVSGGEWIFLVPQGKTDTDHGQCLLYEYKAGQSISTDWHNLSVEPSSPTSEFCIIKGQNESKPMLERIAATLLESTESIGFEESILQVPDFLSQRFCKFYFPVIITNSKICVCHYDPNKISISDGRIKDAEFKNVPSVRFRKSLTTTQNIDNSSLYTLKDVYKATERSVYVVNSDHLINFLTEWDVS